VDPIVWTDDEPLHGCREQLADEPDRRHDVGLQLGSLPNLVDWDYLGPATPRYEFTDTNAPAVPQRFYRLRWP
jgi:hypothetical protein